MLLQGAGRIRKAGVVIGLVAAGATALAVAGPAGAGRVDLADSTTFESPEASGKCTYIGTTTTTGELRYAFGGGAARVSQDNGQPQPERATCTLISPAQGLLGERPELRASTSCSTEPECTLPLRVVDSWPPRPVQICIEGAGIPLTCSERAL